MVNELRGSGVSHHHGLISVDFEVALDEPSVRDLNNEKGGVWYNHRV